MMMQLFHLGNFAKFFVILSNNTFVYLLCGYCHNSGMYSGIITCWLTQTRMKYTTAAAFPLCEYLTCVTVTVKIHSIHERPLKRGL